MDKDKDFEIVPKTMGFRERGNNIFFSRSTKLVLNSELLTAMVFTFLQIFERQNSHCLDENFG